MHSKQARDTQPSLTPVVPGGGGTFEQEAEGQGGSLSAGSYVQGSNHVTESSLLCPP